MLWEKLKKAAGSASLRAYLRRLAVMAAPAFLLMFITLFFGSLDIVNTNQQYLTFAAGRLFWPLLGLTLAGTLVLAALLALLRGRGFGAALGVVFALAVMVYLQGSVLDGKLASLDGSDFRWQDDAPAAWRNLALWLGAAAVCGVLGALLEKKATAVVAIACGALFLGQLVSLIAVWVPEDKSSPNYQLSGDEELVLSKNRNIIVITLDQMSPLIFEQVLELDPDVENAFRDFVYYDNMSSAYSFTFPSMCFLLTGQHFDASVPTAEYVYNAWHSDGCESFYDALHRRGYTARAYVESNYAALTAENMIGKLDNVVEAGGLIVRWPLLKSTIAMSLYRYFPIMLKNDFCVSTGQVVDMAEYRGVGKVRINYDFYPAVRDEGLEAGQDENSFVWYHLQGAHFPFTVDYDGELIWPEAEETEENRLNQLHGYMVALREYFDQLKALGLYDDATIIVSADHGYFECFQAAFLIKTPGQSFETMQVTSAPVAQEDIMPTLLWAAGEDYSDYGTTVFDWSEGDTRVRTTSVWGYMRGYPDVPWIGNVDQWDAEANGFDRYNVFGVFHYVGDRDTILQMERDWYYQGRASEILPLYDSFY